MVLYIVNIDRHKGPRWVAIDLHEKKEKRRKKRRSCKKDNNDLEENKDKGNVGNVKGLSESFDKE